MKSSFLQLASHRLKVSTKVFPVVGSHNIFPLMCLLGFPEMIEYFCLAFMWAFVTGNSYTNIATLDH